MAPSLSPSSSPTNNYKLYQHHQTNNKTPSPRQHLKQQSPNSVSPTSLSSATAIAGFTLSTCIGRGSFSTVWKAHKNRGKYEVVAIKCIKISTLSSKSRDNLINEINILSRINHQHVVSMKRFTWDASHIYLILEYCPGGTLADLIKSKGRLPEAMVQHFGQQLVQGLEILHSQNIVHGDLKPANILLSIPPVGSCRNVKLKIADFGFSQRLNESYATGIKGSPLYMAPEVLGSQPYGTQADLYSLGVILYECLFGQAPYNTNDLGLLTKKILSIDPIYVPRTKLQISDDCCDLLEQLLVKDQEKRMNFNELFRHPFLDMNHSPSIDNYYKGVGMVRQALIFDNARNYEDARAFYVEGLLYLVPVFHWYDSFNDTQRKSLSKRIMEYCARAELLTQLLEADRS